MNNPESYSGYGVFVPQEESEFRLDTSLIPPIDLESLIISGTSTIINMNRAISELEDKTPKIEPLHLRPDIIKAQFAAEIDHPLSNEELYAMFSPEDLRGVILLASAIEYGEHREDALIQGILRGMAIERKNKALDNQMEEDPDLIIIREAVEQFPIDDSNRYKQAS